MTEDEENKIRISDELQKDCHLDNWETVNVTVQIPSNFSAKVRNYHEFPEIQYALKYLGLDYDFEEVGCCGEYEALFYTGPKPINLINKIKETYEN